MTGKLFTMNLEKIFRKGQTPYCTAFGKRSFFHPSILKRKIKNLKKILKKNKREKRDEGEKKCLIIFFFLFYPSTLLVLFCSIPFFNLFILFLQKLNQSPLNFTSTYIHHYYSQFYYHDFNSTIFFSSFQISLLLSKIISLFQEIIIGLANRKSAAFSQFAKGEKKNSFHLAVSQILFLHLLNLFFSIQFFLSFVHTRFCFPFFFGFFLFII